MCVKKITFVTLFSTIFAIMICSAETFMLKNGNRITGTIISHENGSYEVSADFGIIDLLDTDILRILPDDQPIEEEVKQIEIKTNAKVREFIPNYEDEKFYDPLYIAHTQAKFSAKALTGTGAAFTTLGLLTTAICLPIYFNFDEILKATNYAMGLFNDFKNDNGSNKLINFFLPFILTPSIIGIALLLACIGPWIYSTILLKKWQTKYRVDMAYANSDKFNFAFTIKL